MMRRFSTLVAAALLLALAANTARASELSKIKARMKKRYPALEKLRDAGKIGETYLGYVEARKANFRKEKVKYDGKETTVGKLVDAENADRGKAYALIAKAKKDTKENVEKAAGKYHFRKAKANEWIKTKKGWVKKKDLKDDK